MTRTSQVPLTVSTAGATAATPWVGGTVSGAPTTGTFIAGNWAIAQNGHLWICTVGGTPGTWVDAGSYGSGGGGVSSLTGTANQVTVSAATGAVTVSLPSAVTIAGAMAAATLAAVGLTGAVAVSRYVGATAGGAPTTGTFAVGDLVVAQNGKVWVCTVAGTPGTWEGRAGITYTGTGTPPAGTGLAGDFFLTTDTHRLYGPKGTDTAWGSPQVPVLRGSSYVNNSTNTTVTLVAPGGISVGDVIFVIASTFTSTLNTPTGYTLARSLTVTANTLLNVYTKVATSADLTATITISSSSGYVTAVAAGFSFVDTTTPVAANASALAASSVDLVSPSVAVANSTPTVALYAAAKEGGNAGGSFALTPPTSISNAYSAGNNIALSYANTGAVANSATADWGTNVGTASGAITLVLTPQVAIPYNDFTPATLVTTNTPQTINGVKTHIQELAVVDLKVTGLTGAVAASRYVGATASGAPTTGTFVVGDFVIAQNGQVWICTVTGTPGTWVSAGGASGFTVSSITTTTTAVTNTIYLANGTFTVTIPVASNTQVAVKNTGTGTITVAPVSGTLDGGANATLAQYASINVVADGTNVWVT